MPWIPFRMSERPSVFTRVRRAIEAQVLQKNLRDLANRWRFGAKAPLSDMAIYPRPAEVTQSLALPKAGQRFYRRQSGMVKGGDWDTHRSDASKNIKFISCKMHWIEGADWQETPIFRRMMDQIAAGKAPDECRSLQDVLERYARLDQIFEETKSRGRLLNQSELPDYYRREHGATLMHVGHDGACLRGGGGAHRYAMARLLDLPEMPAQLGVVHPDAIAKGHLDRLRISRHPQ